MATTNDPLNLQSQFCFPFYAASRILIQAYREPLEALGLTYPQYLVMLVLWEEDGLSVSQIGARLHLDSGTLTPVLKRLETQNLIKRKRSDQDERRVDIQLTYPGKSLKTKASDIPKVVTDSLTQWNEKELSGLKTQVQRLVKSLVPATP